MRLGELIGSPPINSETDFLIQGPCCTTWIDCRDLGELRAHEDWCNRDQNTSNAGTGAAMGDAPLLSRREFAAVPFSEARKPTTLPKVQSFAAWQQIVINDREI
jgi:hypothetical protein